MVRAEGENNKALFLRNCCPRQGSQAIDPPFLRNQPGGRNSSAAESAQLKGSSPISSSPSLPALAQPSLGSSPGPLHSLPPRALAPRRPAVLSSCSSGLAGVIALAEGVPHLSASQEP